ncbi:MAG: EI24 domain-containing protein [Chitinophagaceae bacterium]
MLKEIVGAIDAYFRAHRFIRKHKLWKWIIIPGILYMLLFCVGMYVFFSSSDAAISYISNLVGVDKWLQKQRSGFLSFIFVMSEIMVRLTMVLFYFSLFKYFFLIAGSPLFAYLSEKTEAILEGKDYPFRFTQLLKDIYRGVRLALRNSLWQTVFSISLLILSCIPVVGWITPVIALFVECYYFGFSMLDYSCERHRLSPSESVVFVGKHRGLAIGNGLIFYLMHIVPFIGWMLAPSYAVVAATISIYYQEKTLMND